MTNQVNGHEGARGAGSAGDRAGAGDRAAGSRTDESRTAGSRADAGKPREIGVGLISVGWMGKVHAKAYQAVPLVYPDLGIRTRLVKAADSSPERAEYAREVLGFASTTTDYREVLADPEVDVVSICATVESACSENTTDLTLHSGSSGVELYEMTTRPPLNPRQNFYPLLADFHHQKSLLNAPDFTHWTWQNLVGLGVVLGQKF